MPPSAENSKPPQASPTGHPLPRRSSPQNSITLQHHRLARDASYRVKSASVPTQEANPSSPRRNSSGESQETGQSDPKNWFNQSNQNPTATFDNNVMEVDPPFFQKGSDYANEETHFSTNPHLDQPQLTTMENSSVDEYRSVIDDLTVEIQRLKEELKRYKQAGPDMLRKEKLFEIKVHGLPQKKKRELETTLRDFAANLQSSPNTSSSQTKNKSSRRVVHDRDYSGSASLSKHASSSSGSNARPADSAYASMSTGAKSSGTHPNRPMVISKDANEKKVENYLRDIPEGLYPRHMIMTDKDRKRLVVRRLEHLFTGKLGGSRSKPKKLASQPQQSQLMDGKSAQVPTLLDVRVHPVLTGPLSSGNSQEPTREAKILPLEQQSGHSGKKSRSRDNGSTSNSYGDGTESGGNGKTTGSGGDPSPPTRPPPEQRPTRPRDLDPDRVQVPSENVDYIRHLGFTQSELLEDEVRPDEEGWVYLNLLCNLAQLHIINVTPSFVRSAVSGMSTKFQLSADGQKIRWRGGTKGTQFSSDSSGYNSQKSPSTDDSDHMTKPDKRQKTGQSTGQSGSSSKDTSKLGLNQSSSESFHYKPIFARRSSSNELTSVDDTLSSFGPVEGSNQAESRWDMSGSGSSNRRKRRHDGVIIYYSGAPFCTDLSGDPLRELSPPSQMLGSSQKTDHSFQPQLQMKRTASGSLLDYRPLSDRGQFLLDNSAMDIDGDDGVPSLTADDTDNSSDAELDLTWSDEKQCIELHALEPSGLGGVLPDDHFVVVVTTKRPKQDVLPPKRSYQNFREESTDSIIRRLSTMSTSSPDLRATKAFPQIESQPFEIEYVSGGIKRLTAVPLPPPALFFSPFSSTYASTNDFSVSEDVVSDESSEESRSRRANPHQSDDYPDGVDLSSGDEEGDDPDDYHIDHNMYDADAGDINQPLSMRGRISPPRRTSSAAAAAGTAGGGSKSSSAERMLSPEDSSAVMAGGAESEPSTSDEESE